MNHTQTTRLVKRRNNKLKFSYDNGTPDELVKFKRLKAQLPEMEAWTKKYLERES